MVNTPKPDFFIVGAPKCGTTAMNDYLATHPDIFMARKEAHYFGSDLDITFQRMNLDAYLALFAGWQGESRIGEASVWYLYSKRAAAEINAFNPDSRIIIMLRNPVDMLYSNYYQFLYNGNENLPTFEEALAAETERKKGQRLPPDVMLPMSLYYRETAKYTEQVRRYFEVFGRERVHVVIFDDFKKDTALVYKKTLGFLGVDDSFSTNFDVINPNKQVRSTTLRRFLRGHTGWPQAVAVTTARAVLPRKTRRQITSRLKRWNTVYTERQPLTPATRHQLQIEFLPEVEKLSQLLDRDLTHWCRVE